MVSSSAQPPDRIHDGGAHQARMDQERSVKRNPHPDFRKVEASRPDWEEGDKWHYTKTRDPNWKWGQGGNDGGESLKKKHVEIDPYAEGRPSIYNYKLLISGIVPRPIGFLSTRSKDGTSTNLAPFSFTQVINHDPPIFIVGFAGGLENAKDTLGNLLDTEEGVLNIISEHFIEAANASSINAPYGISEWALTGLHPADSTHVKASRVKEAVFSTECKLMEVKEFESRATPGKKTGVMAILEGINFWVREDAINEEQNIIDPGILRPMSRLGGISYGRLTEGIELLRPDFDKETAKGSVSELLQPKANGQ